MAKKRGGGLKKAAAFAGAAAFVVLAVLFVVDIVTGSSSRSLESDCEFHFIDVGQGDCTMILTDDATFVIDAGPAGVAGETAAYIRSYTDEINYLILTHPHEDHVGGAAEIIEDIKTDNVIMTDAFSDTYTFSKLINTIERSGVEVTEATAGESYSAGKISAELLAPLQEFDDYNNYSIVSKISFGDVSVICCGDAETDSEKAMVARYTDGELSCDILKLAHHGSSTSSSEEFLEATSPLLAVISCGRDNTYGHPHQSTLKKLDGLNIPYVRTDEEGSLVFCTDGKSIWPSADGQ